MDKQILDDRVYVVAGGGRGLGEKAAHGLAEHGASVVVNDLGTSLNGEGSSPEPAEETARAIREAGGEAVAHFGDASDVEYAADLIADAREEYGRIDGVANFASILRDAVCHKMSKEDWDEVIRVDLGSHFALLKASASAWREEAGDGELNPQRSFLAVSSMSALGNVGQLNYAASNAGVFGFTRTASTELFRYGIRVNTLVPAGYTRMTESVPEEYRPYTREEMPPEKVSPTVTYLLSDRSSDITGCTIYAAGDKVGLMSEPEVERVGIQRGGWTVEDLDSEFRDTIADGENLTRTDSIL